MTCNQRLPATELRLADVIRSSAFLPWNVAIVKHVSENEITLFRPYGTTADFSYTGGVICYLGIEEYKVPRREADVYDVLERRELR